MRQFVADALESRLANEFTHQDLFGLVGELTVRVVRRTWRQHLSKHVDHGVDLGAGGRRNRNDLGRLRGELADRQQLGGNLVSADLVDLGDNDDQGGPAGGGTDLLENPAVAGPDRLVGRDAQADDVNLGVGVAHQVVEPFAEQCPRAVQTGGIDQDDLAVVAVHDAADGVPGGLRAHRGNRDFGPDEGVCQRRLAGVRPADQADEAGMELTHQGCPFDVDDGVCPGWPERRAAEPPGWRRSLRTFDVMASAGSRPRG